MPIIRDALSNLLTFDIEIGPGPISTAVGIDWQFSVSNELTFYQPGEAGFNDGGFSNSFDIGVTSTSIARDIVVADSFDFAYEKRGGILVGVDGASVAVQNATVVDYESWRDTEVESNTLVQFFADGEDATFGAGVFADIDTMILGQDFLPGLEIDLFTF